MNSRKNKRTKGRGAGRWSLVATWLLSALVMAAPQDVPIETLLDRLATYIEEFERDLSAVVAEEHYVQDVSGSSSSWPVSRVLKSDFLLTRITSREAEGPRWVGFRDVFEVDGEPVQDRSDRLMQLFITPTGDVGEQVTRIMEASASHNLGWVQRTINIPTMVLQFAKGTEQGRSQFRLGGRSKAGEHDVREVRFTERSTPRIIWTADNVATQGSFWIDEETGRVHRTEMRIPTGSTTVVIGVSYAHESTLDMWLPVLMTEQYSTPRRPTITGRATYRNFRQFKVTVGTIIKK
jgi:hypothetical protein